MAYAISGAMLTGGMGAIRRRAIVVDSRGRRRGRRRWPAGVLALLALSLICAGPALALDAGPGDAEALSPAEVAITEHLRAAFAALEADDAATAAPRLVAGVDGLVALDADLDEWGEIVVLAAYAALGTRPIDDASRMLALTGRLPAAALEGEAVDLIDASIARAQAVVGEGRHAEALGLLDAAIAGPGGHLEAAQTFEVRALRGGLLLQMGRPAEAAAAFDPVLAGAPPDLDPLIISVAYRNHGQALAKLDQPDAAAAAMAESVAWARAPSVEPGLLAEAMHIRADLLERADRPLDAAAAYAEARWLYAALRGPEHPDTLYAGCHLELLGRGPVVPDECARLLDVRARGLGDHPAVAEAWMMVGQVDEAHGRLSDAVEAFDAAVALQSVAPDPDALATTLRRRAAVRLARADDAGAEADLRWGLALVDALGGPRSMWLHDLAAVAVQRGEDALAAAQLDAAAAERGADGAFEQTALLFARAIAHEDAGEVDAAAPLYAEALDRLAALPETPYAAWWRVRAAGNALRRDDDAAALALARRALVDAEQQPGTVLHARVLTHYAIVAYGRGDDTAAIFHAKRAVQGWQQVRRGMADPDAFQATHAGTYRTLAEVLVERRGRVAEADALLELLAEGAVDQAVPWTPTEARWKARYDAARAALLAADAGGRAAAADAMRSTIESLEAAMREAQEAGSQGAYVTADDLVDGLQPTLAALDAARGSKAALVQVLIGDDLVMMLSTLADGHRFAAITLDTDDLNARAAALARALRSRGEWRALSMGLYADLIDPLRESLDGTGADTLLFIPGGALQYVPMGVLVDPETGRHLVEDYAVARYAPPAPSLADRPRRAIDRVAAFGASKPAAGLAGLPAVPLELALIVQPAGRPGPGVVPGETWVDEAFTADALLGVLAAGASPVVHIASHFVFRPGPASASFLVLGDGRRLGLDRLGAARFDGVELLTLSACQTAVGTFAEGQPLDGFAALALQRGARAVLASLWPVPDDSTAQLMARFYARLAAGEAPIDALRTAQLAMIGAGGSGPTRLVTLPGYGQPIAPAEAAPTTPHPYTWASFVLIGDPR